MTDTEYAVLDVRLENAERRIQDVERDISQVADKINKLILAAVAAAFSFSVAVLLLALNLLVITHG